MRPIAVWFSGASFSVFDVAAGLSAGLEAHGVPVVPFRLDRHLEPAAAALEKAYEFRIADGTVVKRPEFPDVCYHANMGVLERALRYDCEWVVLVSGLYQHPDFVLMLRRAGRKVAFIATEAPYQIEDELTIARLADHVFTNERSCLDVYRQVNRSVSYLPAAWHPTLHTAAAQPEDEAVSAHDVVFVGTGFIERQRLLEAIDWTGVDFGLYGVWELLAADSPLKRHQTVGAIPNARTAALYRRARVGLNLHRTSMDFGAETEHVVGAESLNPRCYELAACGKFFISDDRPEVRDVFGLALPTFKHPSEAQFLIKKALAEPAWREDVAARCQALVQAHSWTARAERVLDVLGARQTVAA